jgi:hypothetical protein
MGARSKGLATHKTKIKIPEGMIGLIEDLKLRQIFDPV